MRFWSLSLLALATSLLAASEPQLPAYPLWDGQESVADYAKRVNLPPTKTLDLGNGVKMDLVLNAGRTQARDAKGTFVRSDFDALGSEIMRVNGITQVLPPSTSGLRAHWNLNESSGDRSDNSGNSITLYDKNSIGYVQGMFDKAASFLSASKTYFAVDGTLTLSLSSMTIAMWAKSNENLSAYSGTGKTLAAKYIGLLGGWRMFLSRQSPDAYNLQFLGGSPLRS